MIRHGELLDRPFRILASPKSEMAVRFKGRKRVGIVEISLARLHGAGRFDIRAHGDLKGRGAEI